MIHPIITANSMTNPYISIPPVPAGNDLWAIKDEGGRISDTLLSRLQLDPARIDQE